MPGMYSHNDYDLAGFAVGVAENPEMDRVSMVRAGHKLIALPSSGLHSNGFSLARKVLFEKMSMKFEGILTENLLSKRFQLRQESM